MAALFSAVFLAMLALTSTLRVWLSLRQMRHVAAHRHALPPAFAERITLADHQKAADYTTAKLRLGLVELAADTLLLLAFTFGGLLAAFDRFWRDFFPAADDAYGLALFASVGLTGFLVGLPFTLWRIFGIEARFGFNKMTPVLFVTDLLKQLVLTVLIGAPLIALVLWLMEAMGRFWWLDVWLTWLIFNLLVLLVYPTFIAPLFNKFTPLAEGEVKQRVAALLERCGFTSAGLFVMDGSKRSAHGNAYFTGFGKSKRIVFFDTLLDKLTPTETEAVLAHELGHYKRRHIAKRIAVMAVLSLALLWLLGQLIDEPWFYEGLHVGTGGTAPVVGAGDTARKSALALILFTLVLPVFSFPLTPLFSWLSRRHEFEADAFAAQQSDARALISALVKLYRDNAATLTPDPLHSLFHDSHPPASQRIAHLESLVRKESAPC
ncbi:M48 family metallopeptidase [Sulfuricystis multivorans]|uniref:M48 family metallopeptidase n=1 Tax=Sulfuricystis multivorans TaxID=2211108 RepID=UPI000F8491A8|nr:M48 family metallopeptidase [Sulfuricystis multivorans]